jgi:hypothetical protein
LFRLAAPARVQVWSEVFLSPALMDGWTAHPNQARNPFRNYRGLEVSKFICDLNEFPLTTLKCALISTSNIRLRLNN